MPVLEIEGVGKVEVDPGFAQLAPEEQQKVVDGIVASIRQPDPAKARQELDAGGLTPDALAASNRGIEQGLSLGAADEFFAGALTPIEMAKGAITGEDKGKGIGERFAAAYNRMLEKERGRLDAARDNNPASFTAGSIGGGMVTAGGLGKAGATLVGRAATLPGRMAAGAAEGAAYGGLYGFNTGEGGLENRTDDALKGAAFGGVIGGAVPAVAAGAKAVTKPVRDAIKARAAPQDYAAEKIAERLTAGGTSPQQAANRIAEAQTRGQNLSLADVGGKSTRSLLRTTTNVPGPAQDRVTTQLNLRQMGQGDRLKTLVGDVLADPDGYQTAKQKLSDTMSNAAKPLYAAAYQRSVPITPKIAEIIQRPSGKAALKQALKLAIDDGVDVQKAPNTQVLDYMKRALDDMIARETDSITGKVTNEGRILTGMKNTLRDHLATHNPEYGQALKVWSSGSELDKALEWGRKAPMMSPETVRREIASLSAGEQDAARLGAADYLRDQIDKAGFTHNAIIRFFSSRQKMGALRELFPDDASFTAFRKGVFDESRRRATYEAVKGNSTTARQIVDLAESGGLDDAVRTGATAVTQGPVAATMQYLSSRLKMLGGMTPRVADEIAKRLMQRDPAQIAQLTQQLDDIAKAQLSQAERANALLQALSRVGSLPVQEKVRPASALQAQ